MGVRPRGIRTETHDLGRLRLYREDMQEIAETVERSGKLRIITEYEEADFPADFELLPTDLKSLTITAGEGDDIRVRVELSETTASIGLTGPGDREYRIREQVQKICTARRTHQSDILVVASILLAVLLTGLGTVLAALKGVSV